MLAKSLQKCVNTSSICTVGQRKKKNTLMNSNRNYRRQMKLMSINIDYCLLQFDALNVF